MFSWIHALIFTIKIIRYEWKEAKELKHSFEERVEYLTMALESKKRMIKKESGE